MFQEMERIDRSEMRMNMQYDQVKELIQIFEHTDLNTMEVALGNASVKLSRGVSGETIENISTPSATSDQSASAQTVAQEELQEVENDKPIGGKVITAPIVGTFYQASAPSQPPFVKVGDTVAEGQVVCIIEAMKVMNEVNSTVSGTVTEVLVEDGQFVEYGQELFRVQ